MDSQEKREILNQVHGVIAQYLMHWHRLSVDASLFIATGSVTITGFALSQSNLTPRKTVIYCGLLILLAIFGFFIRRIVNTHVRTLRGIAQKIDEENGVFDVNLLSTSEMLYPQAWKVSTPSEWNDPIFGFTLFSVLVLPLSLSLIIIIFSWL